jgi:hypothetical protein
MGDQPVDGARQEGSAPRLTTPMVRRAARRVEPSIAADGSPRGAPVRTGAATVGLVLCQDDAGELGVR